MSFKGNWRNNPEVITAVESCEIINYDMRSVGLTIWALEKIKYRSNWVNRDTWITANRRLAEQQERLLMPCGEDIIRELRAMRDGPDTPLAAQDPSTDPFTLDLFSLRSIAGRLSTDGESAAFILADIRDALKSEEDGETMIAVLRAIAAIVVGV